MQEIINNMNTGLLGALTLGLVLCIVSIPFILVRLSAASYWEKLNQAGGSVRKSIKEGCIGNDVPTKKYIIAQLIRQSEKNHWQANLYMGIAAFGAANIIYAMPSSFSGSNGSDWIVVGVTMMIVIGSLHLFVLKRKSIVAGLALLDGLKKSLTVKGNLTVKSIENADDQLLRNVELGIATMGGK